MREGGRERGKGGKEEEEQKRVKIKREEKLGEEERIEVGRKEGKVRGGDEERKRRNV